ncbi:hypothetical protein EWW49_28195, partial [Pseudomonas syringae]
ALLHCSAELCLIGAIFQSDDVTHATAIAQPIASHSNIIFVCEHRTRFQAYWAITEPAIEAFAVVASEEFFK